MQARNQTNQSTSIKLEDCSESMSPMSSGSPSDQSSVHEDLLPAPGESTPTGSVTNNGHMQIATQAAAALAAAVAAQQLLASAASICGIDLAALSNLAMFAGQQQQHNNNNSSNNNSNTNSPNQQQTSLLNGHLNPFQTLSNHSSQQHNNNNNNNNQQTSSSSSSSTTTSTTTTPSNCLSTTNQIQTPEQLMAAAAAASAFLSPGAHHQLPEDLSLTPQQSLLMGGSAGGLPVGDPLVAAALASVAAAHQQQLEQQQDNNNNNNNNHHHHLGHHNHNNNNNNNNNINNNNNNNHQHHQQEQKHQPHLGATNGAGLTAAHLSAALAANAAHANRLSSRQSAGSSSSPTPTLAGSNSTLVSLADLSGSLPIGSLDGLPSALQQAIHQHQLNQAVAALGAQVAAANHHSHHQTLGHQSLPVGHNSHQSMLASGNLHHQHHSLNHGHQTNGNNNNNNSSSNNNNNTSNSNNNNNNNKNHHRHHPYLGAHPHHCSIQTQQQLQATKGFNPMAMVAAGQQTEILTPTHLRKAKLMFFYVRYPNSSTLKECFRDVRFNKNNTAQLVKWFSNFREFYYIQMEKFARDAVQDERTQCKEDIVVNEDHELINQLNNHYNKNRHIPLPDIFRDVVQETLRHFFDAIYHKRDQEQSWKKSIYKVIARLDQEVPELFKTEAFNALLE